MRLKVVMLYAKVFKRNERELNKWETKRRIYSQVINSGLGP